MKKIPILVLIVSATMLTAYSFATVMPVLAAAHPGGGLTGGSHAGAVAKSPGMVAKCPGTVAKSPGTVAKSPGTVAKSPGTIRHRAPTPRLPTRHRAKEM